jgi:NADPH:quinone reductase-like Zn-dependent oxidoreductase
MGFLVPGGVISKNRSFSAFNLGTLAGKESYFKETGKALMRLQADGVLSPVIGKIFPFANIVLAHEELQSGRTFGKVVVVHDC